MVAEGASFGKDNAGENGKPGSGRVGVNGFDDIFGSVALHHFARNGGKRLTHASEEHAQVVVDFGGSSHGASRVAGVHFLLDGDSRRQTLHEVALRLCHLAKKLAGIR